jgi:hypothetical protein
LKDEIFASISNLMTVPFVDLKQQYIDIKDEILSAVNRVFESSQFVLGKEVAGFEEEFAAYCGAQYGIAVNTGTSALHLALLAAGVGLGDEVITVPLTFVATTAAILYTGPRRIKVFDAASTEVIKDNNFRNLLLNQSIRDMRSDQSRTASDQSPAISHPFSWGALGPVRQRMNRAGMPAKMA